MIVDPTAPSADTSVGAVGAVAVAVCVCGALTERPAWSWRIAPPTVVSVTAMNEPGGGAAFSTKKALSTPLSALGLHGGMLFPRSSYVAVSAFARFATSQSVSDNDPERHTLRSKVTVA